MQCADEYGDAYEGKLDEEYDRGSKFANQRDGSVTIFGSESSTH